jgi:hypothetical protein
MAARSYSAKLASIWKMSLPEGVAVSIDSVAERNDTPRLRRVERSERVLAATGWRVARVFGMHPKEIGRPAPTSRMWRELLGHDEA